nr:hypothetical protein [uncultured Sphingomonas sp.]
MTFELLNNEEIELVDGGSALILVVPSGVWAAAAAAAAELAESSK